MSEIHKVKIANTEYDIYDSRFGIDETPTQADWTQTTDTAVDFIKNKPAIWDSEDYTVPDGATYGDSDTKAINAVVLNFKSNNAKGDYSVSEGYQGFGDKTVIINGVSTTLPYGASGHYSHAEGMRTVASGLTSHAEGGNTVAFDDYSHAEGNQTIASGESSHAEGAYTIASGSRSHVEGYKSVASDNNSHAEGGSTTASGSNSHAEGSGTIASGTGSHAEGGGTIASGSDSHAEGNFAVASGGYSHAEGAYTAASGNYSHAEGNYTVASGGYSHAEGNGIIITAVLNAADANSTSYTLSTPVTVSNSNLLVANHMYIFQKNTTGSTSSFSGMKPEKITARTISGNSLTGFTVANTLFTSAITAGAVKIALPRAKNDYAHVQGYGTVSNYDAQHVSGKWNIQATGAEVIGNGTNDLNRSNIRTLDWNGNEWIAGKLTVGATPTATMDVTTKQYVDNAISNVGGLTATVSNNTLFLTM